VEAGVAAVKLSIGTHCSNTVLEVLLASRCKAHLALPSCRSNVPMGKRNALVVDCRVRRADFYGERKAA
jgi:hypothetical protein